MAQSDSPYPVQFSVDYLEEPRDRLSVFLRVIMIIPIAIVLAVISGQSGGVPSFAGAAGGALLLGPLLMIVFRRKYPRWWFDWNLALTRFTNRVTAYLFMMGDQYPSTDEEQEVHLEIPYPDVERDLTQWLPIVKWLLAIPHFIILGPVDRVGHRGLDLLGIHPIHGPLPGRFVRFCGRGDALVKPGQCVCIFADDRCLPAVQA